MSILLNSVQIQNFNKITEETRFWSGKIPTSNFSEDLNPTPTDFSSRLACYSSESELMDIASSDFCFPSNEELIRGIMHKMEMSQAEGPELLIMLQLWNSSFPLLWYCSMDALTPFQTRFLVSLSRSNSYIIWKMKIPCLELKVSISEILQLPKSFKLCCYFVSQILLFSSIITCNYHSVYLGQSVLVNSFASDEWFIKHMITLTLSLSQWSHEFRDSSKSDREVSLDHIKSFSTAHLISTFNGTICTHFQLQTLSPYIPLPSLYSKEQFFNNKLM